MVLGRGYYFNEFNLLKGKDIKRHLIRPSDEELEQSIFSYEKMCIIRQSPSLLMTNKAFDRLMGLGFDQGLLEEWFMQCHFDIDREPGYVRPNNLKLLCLKRISRAYDEQLFDHDPYNYYYEIGELRESYEDGYIIPAPVEVVLEMKKAYLLYYNRLSE